MILKFNNKFQKYKKKYLHLYLHLVNVKMICHFDIFANKTHSDWEVGNQKWISQLVRLNKHPLLPPFLAYASLNKHCIVGGKDETMYAIMVNFVSCTCCADRIGCSYCITQISACKTKIWNLEKMCLQFDLTSILASKSFCHSNFKNNQACDIYCINKFFYIFKFS